MFVYFAVFSALCGLLTSMAVDSPMKPKESHADNRLDKRSVSAMAKNGRLPKLSFAKEKKEMDSDVDVESDLARFSNDDLHSEDKRHVGAFLNSRGKPSFTKWIGDGDFFRFDRSTMIQSAEGSESDEKAERGEDRMDPGEGSPDKRNVASLARLGRLNALRYSDFQPLPVSEKRPYEIVEDMQNPNDEEGCDDDDDEDDDEEASLSEAESLVRPNWMQKKRYVAALARAGRLPAWHSQRIWGGGKRDTLSALALHRNVIAPPTRKCKNKRNLAMLARNGKLPKDKRNLAMLARNGKLPKA